MSVVKIRPVPPSRLAQLIRLPGGLTVAEAIARAETNVAEQAGPALAAMDAALERLAEAIADCCQAPEEDAALDRVFDEAARIVSLAPIAGQPEMETAAASLCDMTERFRLNGRFSGPALHVHLTALRRLRAPASAGEADGRRAMLDGLKRVAQTI